MTEAQPWRAAALPADAVAVGHVQDAWGVRGWLRIHSLSASGDALRHARRWFLTPPDPSAPRARAFDAFATPVEVSVTQARWHGDVLVAQLDGVDDRNTAERLRGAGIHIARADFPPTNGPDEYYWVDLIGLAVVNRQGVALGVVDDLLSTGPHAVLCVRDDAGGEPLERLIPFVGAYVDAVDLVARRITVDWQPDY
ncbi:ribosome maturation factor RimM [Tepidimonas charontis]|uniref:Ribosome maturation factor RimM n=1 Tax=Tepidimonas charontis TaxID=2267262 RepID=A0A554XFS7_9BURK|nr:ribosome maturation factor RimM [Tepidimonas charontis]TSE34629.1 Ribosome maturation factor RimM [Tepidimonas charontis]